MKPDTIEMVHEQLRRHQPTSPRVRLARSVCCITRTPDVCFLLCAGAADPRRIASAGPTPLRAHGLGCMNFPCTSNALSFAPRHHLLGLSTTATCKVRASTLSRGVFFLLSGRIGWTRTRGRTSAYIRPRMTSEDERRQAKTGLEQRALRFVESAKRDRAAKRADMPRRELAGFAGLGEGVRQAGAPGGFDRLRRPPQSERRRLRRALHVDEVLRRSGRLAAVRTCKLQSVSLETRK